MSTELKTVAWLHKQGNFTDPQPRPLDDHEVSRGWTASELVDRSEAEAEIARLAETLRRARPYVLHASTSYYDGTDGAARRAVAHSVRVRIDEALAAAAPSPDGKAEQAEAPSDYPQFLLRKCEHCGCETNAKMRACCKAGWVDDKVASEDRASLATQPTASIEQAEAPSDVADEFAHSKYASTTARNIALLDEIERLRAIQPATSKTAPASRPEFVSLEEHDRILQAVRQPTASNAGEPEPASIKALRDALALQGVPIGNMVDRHTAIERILKAQTAWQAACTPGTIKWLLNRAALASKPQPDQVAQDSVPADILKYAKGMQKQGYSGPLMWASKIIDWVVEQGAARARGEGGAKG